MTTSTFPFIACQIILLLLFITPAHSCSGKIDLILCLDGSGSIGFNDYITVQNFAKDFIEEFSNQGKSFNGEDGLKVGVMQFSSNNNKFTENPVLTSDYDTAKSAPMKNRVSGGTRPDYCLNDAKDAMLNSGQGMRADAEKVIFLVTDGAPNHQQAAQQASDDCIAAGILIIGVGVATGSSSTSDDAIKKMISPPTADNYIKINNFDEMKARLQAISKAVCPVDCIGEWNEWSACNSQTGTRTRTFNIQGAAKDGGDECPKPETESCAVDCVYSFSGWSKCQTIPSANAYYGPWEQSRTVSIAQQPQNGGKACPTGETRKCVPSICYDITSEDSSFKSINNVKAIETLPPNHPSKNRNDCGGPPIGLPKSSPCGLTESQLFYAFDSSTSKSLSTMDTPGVSKFMLLRDSDATHTSFVILNGGNPTSSKYSSYKLKIKFTNDMKGQQAPTTVWSPVSTLPMPVQDQPSTSSGSGTCLASGGSDCYDKYNENSRNGRISWTWSSAETSGGTFGPLPLHGWCVNVQVGDISGINGFQVEDYVGSYTTSRSIDSVAMDYGIDICTKLCTCEGEACGTSAPKPGDLCNGVPCSGGVVNSGGSGDGSGGSGGSGSGSGSESGGNGDAGSRTPSSGAGGSSLSTAGNTPSMSPEEQAKADQATLEEAAATAEEQKKKKEEEEAAAGSIAGGVVTTLILLFLIGGVAVFIVKRRKDKQKKTSSVEMIDVLPDGWESYIDEEYGVPVYFNNLTGEQQWEKPQVESGASGGGEGEGGGEGGGSAAVGVVLFHNPLKSKKTAKHQHSRNETKLPAGWSKDIDHGGNKYYYDVNTGETSWVPPPGSIGGSAGDASDASDANGDSSLLSSEHTRSDTILPEGWVPDFDATSGAKYYYDNNTGEMSWEPPPGSVGGSAESGV